jgi:hypothetical protein
MGEANAAAARARANWDANFARLLEFFERLVSGGKEVAE